MRGKSQGQMQALKASQESIEAVLNEFEHIEFSHEDKGIKVTVFGSMKMKLVESIDDKFSAEDFTFVYDQAIEKLEYDKSVKLAKIRNEVQTKFKFDLASFLPEVQKAVDYLNARNKA
jgi:DNA-binding protein YbaB